jgi:hypothetical protein
MGIDLHQWITVSKYLTYIVYRRGVIQLFKDI